MKNFPYSGLFFLVFVIAVYYFYSQSVSDSVLLNESSVVEREDERGGESTQEVEPTQETESSVQGCNPDCTRESEALVDDLASPANLWSDKCKEVVPSGFDFFCRHISGAKPFQCLEYMLKNNLSLTQSEFGACGKFSDLMEIQCLEELRPGHLDDCVGVSNEFQIGCLQIARFQYRKVCSQIDNTHAVSCVRLLYDRDWNSLLEAPINACALTSESVQVQCFREAVTQEEANSCFPVARVDSLVRCFHYQEAVFLEVKPGKKVILNVDKGVFIAAGQLFVKIDPSIREFSEPIELIRTPALHGLFDKILGLGPYGVEYRNSRLLLVEAKSKGPKVQDLREDRYRGPLNGELYRQKCSRE